MKALRVPIVGTPPRRHSRNTLVFARLGEDTVPPWPNRAKICNFDGTGHSAQVDSLEGRRGMLDPREVRDIGALYHIERDYMIHVIRRK